MSLRSQLMRRSLPIHRTTVVLALALNGCSQLSGHSSEDVDAYGDTVRKVGVTWDPDKKPTRQIDVDMSSNDTPPVLPVPDEMP